MRTKISKISAVFALANFLTFLTGCPAVNPEGHKHEGAEDGVFTKSTVNEDVWGLHSIPFECTEGICLWWDLLSDAESYRIFRYFTPDENDLDSVLPDVKVSNYIDKSAVPDEIYYYRVACIKKGYIYKMTDQFVPAIFSSIGDNFESNNDILKSWNLESGEYKALIYSLNQGHIQDTDYYRVPKNSGIYSLTILFPEKNPAIKNLRLVYGGVAMNLECGGHEFYIDSDRAPDFKIEYNENFDLLNSRITYRIILKSEFPLF